jgi:rod shape-determining protein MreC
MRNILLLFARYGTHLLFIGLEIVCFYLIVNYNQTQKDIWLNSSNIFSGFLNEKVDNTRDYFHLESINDSLQIENSKLLQRLINSSQPVGVNSLDSNFQKFRVIPATICGLDIHKRYNYFNLCEGTSAGIRSGMGVVTENGVVGVVRDVSNNYSTVLPLINAASRTSCIIKTKNFPGILTWKSSNPLKMTLEDVPKHANLNIGDTIVTSGYSTIFPKGIPVGEISNFITEKGSATYIIDVNLWEDLTKLEYVYVIENQIKVEIDSLNNLLDEE